MADDTTTNGAETSAPAAEPQNTGNMVPQARFNEVNSAMKDMRAELDALKATNQAAETKRLEDQEEWKTLAEQRAAEIEQLKTVQTHATGLEATVQSVLDAQLADLPDDVRKAIEDMPGNAQQKLDWYAKNRAALTRPAAPQMDAGARGDRMVPDKAITSEEMPAFLASGMSKEDWNKKKQARQAAPEGSFLADLRARNQSQE